MKKPCTPDPSDWAEQTPLPAPRVIALLRGDEPSQETSPPLEALLPAKALERLRLSPGERRALATLTAHRLLQGVPIGRLDALHCLTKHSRYRRRFRRIHPANLRILEPPPEMSAPDLARVLRRLPAVAHAYVERRVGRPCADLDCAPLLDHSGQQIALRLAPEGMSGRYVWPLAGGKGQGIPFALIDAGWNLENGEVCHCDLPIGMQIGWGMNGGFQDKQHGMASLGLVLARHEGGGVQGFAPEAGPVHLLSLGGAPGELSYTELVEAPEELTTDLINPWNALVQAIDRLTPEAGGARGVILLELQVEAPPTGITVWAPAETEPALRLLIGMAAALGLTVIEPAGNGRTAIQQTFMPDDLSATALSSPAGAILVAAASAEKAPLDGSNFGPIIDCFGPGEDVPSLSYRPNSARTALTTTFSGTSAASATVAGAALCAQGLNFAMHGRALAPDALRKHLRQGSPPASGEGSIGRLPNLAQIAEAIGLAPLYFRDFPGHGGASHTHETTLNSPDLWIGEGPMDEAALAEFAAELGPMAEGRIPEASLLRGAEAHLRLRLRSRGGEALPEVKIALFAVPDPPMGPADWTPVAELTLPAVAGGDAITVSDALVWTVPAALPDEALLVALATSPCFPALMFEEDGRDGEAFLPFVRRNPRVTFRRCAVSGP